MDVDVEGELKAVLRKSVGRAMPLISDFFSKCIIQLKLKNRPDVATLEPGRLPIQIEHHSHRWSGQTAVHQVRYSDQCSTQTI